MNDKSYNNWVSMSDKALMEQVGSFVRHHRLQQNKTQKELSEEAGVSRSTLSLLERGETVTVRTLLQVLRVLDQLQIMDSFRVEEVVSPIALARMEKEKRQRARKSGQKNPDESEW